MMHTVLGALRVFAYVALGALALVVAPLLIGRALLKGLRTGVILGRRTSYSRTDDPVLFWVQVWIDIAVLAGWAWLMAALVWITVSNP